MSLWAILAVPPNSNSGSFVPNAQTSLRTYLFPRVLCPPSGPPYRPGSWLNYRQTPAVPYVPLLAVRTRGVGNDTLSRQSVSGRAPGVAAATAGFDCVMRGPAAGMN